MKEYIPRHTNRSRYVDGKHKNTTGKSNKNYVDRLVPVYPVKPEIPSHAHSSLDSTSAVELISYCYMTR